MSDDAVVPGRPPNPDRLWFELLLDELGVAVSLAISIGSKRKAVWDLVVHHPAFIPLLEHLAILRWNSLSPTQRDHTTTAEIISEVYVLQAYQNRHEDQDYPWNPTGRFGNYLTRLLHLSCLEVVRDRLFKRTRTVPLSGEEAAGAASASETVTGHETWWAIVRAIRELPARFRDIARWHLLDGQSQTEIAEHLGCSKATISEQLKRIRELLQSRLGSHFGSES